VNVSLAEEIIMNSTTNPSAIRSRNEITKALIKLMGKYPYNEITVTQIVMETDLVRKTFYRNFNSKDDVLDSIINSAIIEYTDALTESDEDPLTVIFTFCEKNKKLLKLLHKNNMLYLLLLKLNEALPKISETTEKEKNPFAKLMTGLEPDYLIAFNIGAVWNVIFKWVDRGMTDPPEKIKATIEEYLKRLNQT